MNTWALARWETVHAVRTAVPARWLRSSLFAAAAAGETAYAWLLWNIPHGRANQLPAGFLIGFVAFNLFLATGAASREVAALIGSSGRFTLQRLSPSRQVLYVPLAPVIFAAVVPLTLFALPLIAWQGRWYPLLALATAAAGLCAFGWALTIAIGVGAALARRIGRERSARLLRALGSLLALGALVSFGALARLRWRGVGLVAVLPVSIVLLPLALRGATRALLLALELPEEAPSGRDPRWGSPGWAASLGRGLTIPLAATFALGLAVLAWMPNARFAVLPVLLFSAVAAPLDHLLRPELECPARLALAPRGAWYRRSLIFKVGGGAVACALVLAAALAFGNWRWLGLTGCGLLLLPFTWFLPSRLARAAQLALLAGAFWATITCGLLPR